MLAITILAVGTLKEKALHLLCDAYAKRLAPFVKVAVQEVAASKLGNEAKDKAIKEEGDRLLAAIPPRAQIILLTEHGTTYSSTHFAEQLPLWSHQEQQRLCFVIGGAFGLDQRLHAIAHTSLSLSPMTFPHEWARLLLLEQLFRANAILTQKTYHY